MEAVGALAAGNPAVPSVAGVLEGLSAVRVRADGAGMFDQLRELEDLKSAAAVKQAQIAVALDLSQRQGPGCGRGSCR